MKARHPGSRAVLVAVGLALLVAGCAQVNPSVCPRAAVLGAASSITKMAPGTTGPNGVIVEAEMIGLELDCIFRGEQAIELESNFVMDIIARRGPALRGDVAEVEYFVVITDRAGNVLTKEVFPLRLPFSGRNEVRIKEHTWQYYRLEKGTRGSSYEIWAGFQLSDTELRMKRGKPQ